MDASELSDLLGEVVAGEGGELVELRIAGSRRKPLLRAYVDLPGGTTVEACAALSRKIEARLEGGGLVGESYVLEVSSPGLDRPLRARRDFLRLLGRAIELRAGGTGGTPRDLVGTLEEVGHEDASGEFAILLRPRGAADPLRVARSEIVRAAAHLGQLTRTDERRGARRGGKRT